MSSPNISFDNIPSSIRKPGQYFEFNTKLAVRTLPANAQKVLIVAPMLASGSIDPLVATSVFSGDEAAVYFGYGSVAHLMVVAAINTYAYLDLTVIGVSDAVAGIAAAGTLTITGPASSQGVVSLWVGNTRVDVAVSAADTATLIAAAMKTAIDNQPELPVTATVAAGVLTLTAKNNGAAGNGIRLRAQTTASGTTTAVAAMAGGDIDPDIAPALANVVAAGHNIIISPFSTQTTLTALRTHLDLFPVQWSSAARSALLAGRERLPPGPRWRHSSTAVASRWAGITVPLCCRQRLRRLMAHVLPAKKTRPGR
ncbi:Mu-like prophage tail sheath protein gpL [Klebsiella pneumoniae]|nr:Mu-like prophage tail sheath protein gpL [Klebsiella pneumoniae]